MSNKPSPKRPTTVPGYELIQRVGAIEEYRLTSNGLRLLYLHRPGTETVTTNIVYLVGARDEARGETGLAHMLEHMLFKPTAYDRTHRITDGSAMHFERTTGSTLNANTWKDRTTYYFSTPSTLLGEALRIEADRMEHVILTDQALRPEQGNVLSEFDMYNGEPEFALAVQMYSTAFHSHPYGHETIGYREDIEDYTAEKLARFYRNYYRPDNAVLMIIGDVDRAEALSLTKQHFGSIKPPATPIPRQHAREPKQEGIRRVYVTRPARTNIVSLGLKHAGFPSRDWFITSVMLQVLADGPESILHRLLVDSGRAASVASAQEPTSEENLAHINITLSPSEQHDNIETTALAAISALTAKDIDQLVKKCKAGMITDELFARTDSLRISQELTEYVAAAALPAYAQTAEILASISTKDVLRSLQCSFAETNLTIGHFIGNS